MTWKKGILVEADNSLIDGWYICTLEREALRELVRELVVAGRATVSALGVVTTGEQLTAMRQMQTAIEKAKEAIGE